MTTSSNHATTNDSIVVVLPGDNVTRHVFSVQQQEQQRPKLGTGLRYDPTTQQVFATVAGPLQQKQSGRNKSKVCYYIRHNLRRYYQPTVEDRIVGVVQDRIGSDPHGGDVYRIQINASSTAILSNLAFEGATKRNKPYLLPGQLIYCRVASMSPYLDPVLSCQLGPHDGGVPRKDWMTAEGTYGELKGGTCCRISTGLARQLLNPNNTVLSALAEDAKRMAFEVAIGVNGMLWIHSTLPEYTILIQNAITNSQVLTEAQIRAMVKSLVYTVQKQLQKERDAMEE